MRSRVRARSLLASFALLLKARHAPKGSEPGTAAPSGVPPLPSQEPSLPPFPSSPLPVHLPVFPCVQSSTLPQPTMQQKPLAQPARQGAPLAPPAAQVRPRARPRRAPAQAAARRRQGAAAARARSCCGWGCVGCAMTRWRRVVSVFFFPKAAAAAVQGQPHSAPLCATLQRCPV